MTPLTKYDFNYHPHIKRVLDKHPAGRYCLAHDVDAALKEARRKALLDAANDVQMAFIADEIADGKTGPKTTRIFEAFVEFLREQAAIHNKEVL